MSILIILGGVIFKVWIKNDDGAFAHLQKNDIIFM